MFPLRDSERSENSPLVTMLLIAINTCVFVYQLSLGDFELDLFFSQHGVVPKNLQFVDLLTSQFMHGSWMHLLGNMWFLWVFGDNIEDILGHGNYFAFYLACGFAGGLGHFLANPSSHLPTVGASGAISGVMGAYLLKFPNSRVTTLIFFIMTVEVSAVLMIGLWFLSQLFSGFGSLAASSSGASGTAWFAHIGGFLAGCILIKLLPTRARWKVRRKYEW